MKELKDLVVGDAVLVVGVSCRRIAKIDKVTKTQIVVDNVRYSKVFILAKNGRYIPFEEALKMRERISV